MRANSGSGTSSPVVVFQLPPSLEGETGDICAKELLPCLDPIHPHPLICPLLENTASRTYARDLNGFSAVNAHTRLSGRERAWGPAVACCGFQRCQRAHDVPLRAMGRAVYDVPLNAATAGLPARAGAGGRSVQGNSSQLRTRPVHNGPGRAEAGAAPLGPAVRRHRPRVSRPSAHGICAFHGNMRMDHTVMPSGNASESKYIWGVLIISRSLPCMNRHCSLSSSVDVV